MADQPDNIVLEHLRHIRRVVDKLEADVTELKSRVTSFEGTLGYVRLRSAISRHRSQARQALSDRIEQRLDLTHA